MGLLDDNNYTPRFKPKQRKYKDTLTEEERMSELNNTDRPELTEDFSDSKFADRKE